MHTVYSDGVHEIEEVIALAREKGIRAVAVCDHDTMFHYDKVKEVCDRYGMECIRGVEMSCYDPDVYKKVHILGLWLKDNPVHSEQLCRNTLKCRDAYHHKLIQILNEKISSLQKNTVGIYCKGIKTKIAPLHSRAKY